MSEKDKIREELERLSPRLSKIKENSRPAFKAPEGYFQSLPDDVMRRIRAEEGLVRESRPAQADARNSGLWAGLQWLLLPRRALVLATTLLLVAVGAYLFLPQSGNVSSRASLASISEEEAKTYVSENIGDFELELMLDAALVSTEDVPEIEVLPGLEEEDIDAYLDELIEDMDLEELEDLL